MALIQVPAYRSRRRMQRMTASGTMPSTEPPSPSSARTSELDTATWGPSTHSARQPGGIAGRRAGRPGHDGQRHQPPEVLRAMPGAELRHQVGPDDEEELCRLAARFRQDLLGGVHRVAGAAPLHFEPARLGPGYLLGQELGQRVAVRSGRDRPLSRLLPGIVGHDEQEAVEAQLLCDGAWPRRRDRRAAGRRCRRRSRCGSGAQVPASSAITGASASISASCTTM